MAKWTGDYTPPEQINNGNEYTEDSDVTTDTFNIANNNALYAINQLHQAEITPYGLDTKISIVETNGSDFTTELTIPENWLIRWSTGKTDVYEIPSGGYTISWKRVVAGTHMAIFNKDTKQIDVRYGRAGSLLAPNEYYLFGFYMKPYRGAIARPADHIELFEPNLVNTLPRLQLSIRGADSKITITSTADRKTTVTIPSEWLLRWGKHPMDYYNVPDNCKVEWIRDTGTRFVVIFNVKTKQFRGASALDTKYDDGDYYFFSFYAPSTAIITEFRPSENPHLFDIPEVAPVDTDVNLTQAVIQPYGLDTKIKIEKSSISVGEGEYATKITFPQDWIIRYGDKANQWYRIPNGGLVYEYGRDSGNTHAIVFNAKTKQLRGIPSMFAMQENEYYLFTYAMGAYDTTFRPSDNDYLFDIPQGTQVGPVYVNYAKIDPAGLTSKITIEKNPSGQGDYPTKITFPADFMLRFGTTSRTGVYNLSNKVFEFDRGSGGRHTILFNVETKEFRHINFDQQINDNEVYVFSFAMGAYDTTFRPNEYENLFDIPSGSEDSGIKYATIDPYGLNDKIKIEKNPSGQGDYPTKITFPADFTLRFSDKYNGFYDLSNKVFEFDRGSGGRHIIVFNTTTQELKHLAFYEPIANDEYYVFAFAMGAYDTTFRPNKYENLFDTQEELKYNVWTSGDVTYDIDIAPKLNELTSKVNDALETDAFVFFTDPHPYSSTGLANVMKTHKDMITIQKYANNGIFNFVICGGDWLNNSNTKENAKQCLTEINGFTKTLFKPFYGMVGNHDTNYQGTGEDKILSNPLIANLWYQKYGKNYYSFDTLNTKYYVLDTGIDWDDAMTPYRWTQIDWFANCLIKDDTKYSAVCQHIWLKDPKPRRRPLMAQAVADVITAYNNKTILVLNNKTYDFSKTTGRVKFGLAGHLHDDDIDIVNNSVPIILTRATYTGVAKLNFDLAYVDYTNDVISLVRVGDGDNRTISMTTGQPMV